MSVPSKTPSDAAEPAVRVSGLRVDAAGRTILNLSDWTVPAAGQALLLGPSGSGKTTLLHVVAGLLRPSAGEVRVAGRAIGDMAAAELDAFRGLRLGIIFQTLHLIGALSVSGNLRLARFLAKLPPDDAAIAGLLAALGLADRADARPRDLSQGEAQRVAIARAVVNRPALILADEPTSALDDANAGHVVDLLRAQAAACGAALLIATHDRRIADRFADRLELAAPR